MAGGRNRERMLLSRYMTPPNFDSVTRGGFTRAAFLLALLLSSATAAFAQAGGGVALSPTERKIRAHQAEQISFLEKAVNISSGTFNLPGVREVGRLFEPEFAALGFSPSWVALPDAVGR